MSQQATALTAEQLRFSYGSQPALQGLDLEVAAGQTYALLGPNGSGKSTLFRLISTLAAMQQGSLQVFGHSVSTARSQVRSMLGVVFQSPSLDGKLTVRENIRCQAALYGLRGAQLSGRMDDVVAKLGLEERLDTPAEQLSGGLKRRVELAKGLLHRPRLLLMDEPSTGLDPAARLDMWHAVQQLRQSAELTVLFTTHLLEEADKADGIAILHQGRTVANGEPAELRGSLGGQVLSIQTEDIEDVLEWLRERTSQARRLERSIQVIGPEASELVAPLNGQFGNRIRSITLGQPSLEDVFVARTGHRFWKLSEENVEAETEPATQRPLRSAPPK